MSNYKEIINSINSGNVSEALDWSSGDTPGAGLSQVSSHDADGPVDSYDSYLQSLTEPKEEAVEGAQPSEQATVTESAEEPASSNASFPATEELYVTLENGRRAKITADYSDRTKIKKAYEMAAGMRKFQAERDQERARIKELDSQMQELKGTWDKLETAYQSGGIEGLIDLLEGKAGASKDYIAKRVEQERLREAMSPAERAQLDLQERYEQDRRRQESQERIQAKRLEEMQARLAEADEKETRAMIAPSFERHRFKGKLGDPVAEHHFDQAVWMQALSNLEQLEESELSPEVIDREFAKVSSAFARAAKQQAVTATKKAVDAKKQEAKTQAAVSAMKGLNTQGTKEAELTKRLWAGDTAGVLKELLMNNRKKG